MISTTVRGAFSKIGCELSPMLAAGEAPPWPVLTAAFAELLDALAKASEGASRVRGITRDILVFAQVDPAPPGLVDVRAVVESSLQVAWHELRHRARVVRKRSLEGSELSVATDARRAVELIAGEDFGPSGIDFYVEMLRVAPDRLHRVVFMAGGATTTRARAFLAGITNPASAEESFSVPLRARLDLGVVDRFVRGRSTQRHVELIEKIREARARSRPRSRPERFSRRRAVELERESLLRR